MAVNTLRDELEEKARRLLEPFGEAIMTVRELADALGRDGVAEAALRDMIGVVAPSVDEAEAYLLEVHGDRARLTYKFKGPDAAERAEAFAEEVKRKGYEAAVSVVEHEKAFVDVAVGLDEEIAVRLKDSVFGF